MARGARSKKDTRFFHKHKHTLESNAQEVDPALMERFRSTRQPIRKSQLFSEILKQKKDTKRARREVRERERKVLKDKAPEKSIPKTKERLRQADVTVIDNKEDGEIINDEADDEFASYFKSNSKAKILITTGEHPCYRTKQLMKELL